MSKKRFSDGLDDLLSNMTEVGDSYSTADEATDVPFVKKRSSGKNFISDLDFLLQEAMDDLDNGSSDSQQYSRGGRASGKQSAPGKSKSQGASGSTGRSPLTGLDALIRSTISVSELEAEEANETKRLTVSVQKQMLKKLKSIARMENQFLKDIMSDLIDTYIQEYATKKNLDL